MVLGSQEEKEGRSSHQVPMGLVSLIVGEPEDIVAEIELVGTEMFVDSRGPLVAGLGHDQHTEEVWWGILFGNPDCTWDNSANTHLDNGGNMAQVGRSEEEEGQGMVEVGKAAAAGSCTLGLDTPDELARGKLGDTLVAYREAGYILLHVEDSMDLAALSPLAFFRGCHELDSGR